MENKMTTSAALSAGVVLLSMCSFIGQKMDKDNFFSLSIANVIVQHIRPWVYVTAGFVCTNFIQLIFNVPWLFMLGKKIEPVLGSVEMLRMLLFVNVLGVFLIFCLLFSLYIVFRLPVFLHVNVCGVEASLMALTMALIQQNPQQLVCNCMQFRFVPLLLVGFILPNCYSISVYLGMEALQSVLISALALNLVGFYLGWYYMRFLRRNPQESTGETMGVLGDVSADFALEKFFPSLVSNWVRLIANFSFNVVKLCGFFKNRPSNNSDFLPVTVPAVPADPISDRRKARAMKALDRKLATLATPPVLSEANAAEHPQES